MFSRPVFAYDPPITSIEISRAQTITIPSVGTPDATSTVTGTVYCDDHSLASNQGITWSIQETAQGVSINPTTGLLTVGANASPGIIHIVGTSIGSSVVSSTYAVSLLNAVAPYSQAKVNFAFDDGATIDVTVVDNVYSYDLDIPAGNQSVKITPTIIQEGNLLTSVTNFSAMTNGTSGQNNDGTGIRYQSENGVITVTADATIGGVTRRYTFNLFRPDYNGIRVTPQIQVGDWNTKDVSISSYGKPKLANTNVFLGSEFVELSLPSIHNNKVKGFTINGVAQNDVKNTDITYLAQNHYIVKLSNNTESVTTIWLSVYYGNSQYENTFLTVNKMALTAGTIGHNDGATKGNRTFDIYVNYTSHPSFTSIRNPEIVVMYYNFDTVNNITTLLGSKHISVSGSTLQNPTVTVKVGEVKESDKANTTPNIIGVFIVDGSPDLNSTTFGGIKYGVGLGWYEVLPNYPGLDILYIP